MNKMKMLIDIIFSLLMLQVILFGQGVVINKTSTEGDPSAALNLSSTTQGVLIPRMTKTERNAIASPAEGLVVFQTDSPVGLKFYNGSFWIDINGYSGTGVPNSITNNSDGVSINTTGATADPSAILDVSSTTKGVLLPRMIETERIAIASPATGLLVYQTDGSAGLYCYEGSEWRLLFYKHYIGESYGGGIIFYIDETGSHGLIAATDDMGSSSWYEWGAEDLSGASRDWIYSGYTNTFDIIRTAPLAGDYAAKVCADFVSGGYDDWFFPSKDEFYQMWLQKDLIGNFTNDPYYTSTETQYDAAWIWEINNFYEVFKSEGAKVRAIREF